MTDCDLMTAHPADSDAVTKGVEFDWIDAKKAVRACERAVNNHPETPRFRYQLARALQKTGQQGEAVAQVRSAADEGYPAAMLLLGFLYRNGQGVPQNMDEAVRWYEKAANGGNPLAATILGIFYLEGKDIPRDLDKSFKWHLKAAAGGEAQAMYNLGFMNLNGAGVRKDTAKGMQWLQKSAENGYGKAALELGLMYQSGRLVRKDIEQALRWYFKAADNGSAYANYRLAQLCLQGKGVDRDDRAAAEFMFQAIQRGYIIMPEKLAAEARKWSSTFRREFQRILKEEGFYGGAIDGGFGPQTRQAVSALSDSRYGDTDRNSAADTENKPMLVNIPELNVFPRPSVRAIRLGSMTMGDWATVRRWHDNAKGEHWARICSYRFCGWVAAEFLKDAPAPSPTETLTTEPGEDQSPSGLGTLTTETPPEPEEGLGTLD